MVSWDNRNSLSLLHPWSVCKLLVMFIPVAQGSNYINTVADGSGKLSLSAAGERHLLPKQRSGSSGGIVDSL